MNVLRAGGRIGVLLAVVGAALALAAPAFPHAEMTPAVALSKRLQLFTLAVPTEKENATTSKVELTPPSGFAIDSFVPAPGWTRKVQESGSGEQTQIHAVTWSGGSVPSEEDAVFQFLASPDAAQTYAFTVRQTYSDGSVVDWTGPESSDSPSPTIEAKSSLGGGTSTLAIVALAVAIVAAVLALVSLLARAGGRALA
jgi:uncharacterized protein YcnI